MNYSSVVTISPKDGSCSIVREPDLTFLNEISSLQSFPEENLEERVVADKSLSFNDQITDVDDSSVQSACSSQQATVRGIGRKCAAIFCVEASSTLHTFPLISKKNKAIDPVQVQRCETWVSFSKNVTLQAVPLSLLNKKFFLCANHFQTNQYYREDRKRLLPNAIPNVLYHDASIDTTETNNINEDFSTVGVNIRKNVCTDQIIDTEIDDNERNNEECAINQATSKDNFCNDQTNDTEKSDTERNNDMCEIGQVISKDKDINIDRSNNTKNRGRSCAAVSCQSTRLLHAFPRTKVNGVDDDVKLGIVKVWVQKSGNIRLLEVPTSSLHSKFYLCSNHFDDDCFFDCLSKTLLIPNAVPTIFDNNHLSDGDMQQFPVRSLDEIMFSRTLEDMLYDVFQKNFEDRMDGLVWETCDDCKESFLKKKNAVNLKCLHKKHCHLYCDSNNMDPGVVPHELENLTYVEQQLISRIHTNISVRKVYSRGSNQMKYRGNTINFPQDVSSIAKVLPHKINDLPIITVRMQKENDHKDFYVNAKRVRDALIFLKSNNKYYSDVEISEDNLNELPENQSIYNLLKGVDGADNEMNDDCLNVPSDDCDSEISDTDSVDDDITNSFVPGVTLPNQDEQVKNVLNWPTIDSTPINEFKHEGYMILAFPSLFAWGKAGLRCERKNKVQPKEYFKHLLRYHDRRFAQHPSFRYFAMNSLMRWESLNDGQAFVKRNSEFSKLNNEELKEKISSNPNLLKKIVFQGKSIRGSKPFWKCRQNELRAMVDQIGLPSLFFTLSAADLHWPDLYRILIGPGRDLKSLKEWERRKLLEENPIIVDTFFTMRVEAFIEEVLTPKLNVTDHWFRVEYQHRGSPHIHGVLYCKDAPDVTKVTDINSPEALKVLKFYDNLISTMNPGQDLPKADEHPCRIHLKDVENHSVGLAQLLNRVQRHTVHSKGYCWRYNKKKKEECRFGFPKELESDSKLDYDENGFLVFISKRNDTLLNRYNGYIISTWRANIDISPVISKEALIAYLSKYITKSEQKSQDFIEISKLILSNAKSDDSALRTIQRMLIKLCSDRDVSAQEVGHYVMGLKYYSAGERQFVTVNMNAMDEVVISNTSKVEKSFLVKYLQRSQKLEALSLWEVAKYYRLPSGSKRSKLPAIVMVYPVVHERPIMEDDDDYYKFSVLLHVPWRKLEDFLNDGLSWKQHFQNFKVEQKLKNKVINESDLLTSSNDGDSSDSDSEDLNSLYLPREDWMNIAAMQPSEVPEDTVLGFREIDVNCNWNESLEFYKQYGDIEFLQTFIKQKKQILQQSSRCESVSMPADVQFTEEQQKVLDLLSHQISNIKNENNVAITDYPKRTIVQGKAGTGKSLLIHKMVSVIEDEFGLDSVLLLAPTGMAALNINGSTIHSKLIISAQNISDFLKSKSERKLQETLEKIKFVIIDEYSMMGATILNAVDRRLRQGTGNVDCAFGNLPIYLFGDVKQLPAVGDTALYKVLPGDPVRLLLDSFESTVILSQVKRQSDSSFIEVLDNIGNGSVEMKDYDILRNRFRSNVTEEERQKFDDSTYIFSTNLAVKEFNFKKLRELKSQSGNPVPIARIPAVHNCTEAKNASADKANGLEPILCLGKGSRIMLRHNFWTETGLVNGACGTVVDIIYEEGKSSPEDIPAVIICKFDNYKGPYLDEISKTVPIPIISKSWNGVTGKCMRSQFPLDQAYAITIHKSQGISLDRVRVNIGKNEFQLGITYVALSRARTLHGLLIDDFDFGRLNAINANKQMPHRKEFEDVLKLKAL